ncbi:MAG TPA: SRPBCC domain-containing protein [Opitutaceae bacterium]|nr:SRPBCC domain-containing protein [Opitutaceae bacterium]
MTKKTPRQAAGSHETRLEIEIHASQRRVWDALVNEATHWWPKTFYSSERTKKFVIEPRLGGRVGEDYGGGEGFNWYVVNGVESPNFLLLVGHMGPPFGGPFCSLLRLELAAAGDQQTKLTITDAVFGQVDGCDNASGWRQIFDEGFRPYVESAPKKRGRGKPKPNGLNR